MGARDPAIIQAAWRQVAPDLTAAAKKVRADLYIAHYPAALPAAAIAARLHEAAYAFDAEDFHLGDPPDNPAFDQQRLVTDAIERRYLPGCAFVTAASPAIAEAYVQAYGIVRPTVLLNAFPRAQGPLEATPQGDMSPRPSIYWFSQTIGPGRGLEVAVRAIARAESRPHLYLRGHPAKGFREQLEAMARETGVSARVHFLPPAPPAEMERLAARFDVGLSGEPGHTPNNRLALGNKLFSYLLAGLPIAASDVPSHQRFAAEAPEAIRLFGAGEPGSLAEALDSLLLSDKALATARAAAFRLGQERYNWDIEKEALLSCIGRFSSFTSERGP